MRANDQLATAAANRRIHFARQMRHEKRNVESARKEPRVQQQIAAIFDRILHGLPWRGSNGAGAAAHGTCWTHHPHEGSAPTVITASDHIAPIHPSIWISVCATGENELPQRSPGVDDAAALPRLSS